MRTRMVRGTRQASDNLVKWGWIVVQSKEVAYQVDQKPNAH